MSTIENILNDFESNFSISTEFLKFTFNKLVALDLSIPLSGSGQTYERWQILAQVAGSNLALAKVFESHLDAISILNELKIQPIPTGRLAVWAAEGSKFPISFQNGYCKGTKNWCSAADFIDFGLMTYKNEKHQSQLLLIELQKNNIEINLDHWQAIGMKETQTASLKFLNSKAKAIGKPDDYLTRPGFWHGAAGIAICWYGATVRLASYLQDYCQKKGSSFHFLYLGQVTAQLTSTRYFIKEVAQAIDYDPLSTHELMIRILRARIEDVANTVLNLVGNALGARPFCEDPIFANLAADLPVFLRQSHAAFDLEKIGKLTIEENLTWTL